MDILYEIIFAANEALSTLHTLSIHPRSISSIIDRSYHWMDAFFESNSPYTFLPPSLPSYRCRPSYSAVFIVECALMFRYILRCCFCPSPWTLSVSGFYIKAIWSCPYIHRLRYSLLWMYTLCNIDDEGVTTYDHTLDEVTACSLRPIL